MSQIDTEALVTTWWLASVMGCPSTRACNVVPALASETKWECDVYMQPGGGQDKCTRDYQIVVWLVELGRGLEGFLGGMISFFFEGSLPSFGISAAAACCMPADSLTHPGSISQQQQPRLCECQLLADAAILLVCSV
jgi:hypothetical protein